MKATQSVMKTLVCIVVKLVCIVVKLLVHCLALPLVMLLIPFALVYDWLGDGEAELDAPCDNDVDGGVLCR